MKRTIKLYLDPYGDKINLFQKEYITLEAGITVLVGANGSGKSTLLHNISEFLENEKIPVATFNNLKDGGSRNIDKFMAKNNFEMASVSASSSEGENIMIGIATFSSKLREFIETGVFKKYIDIFGSFDKKQNEKIEKSNERWILFDATDSGLSIDNIIEIKDFFKMIIEDGKKQNIDIYIIISANEYELANGEKCFDVASGEYISFDCYDEFKEFIIQSRKLKDIRIEKIMEEDNKNEKDKEN